MCRECAQIVGGSREAGCAADASEPEDGSPLYIRSHRQAINQLGVDAGRGDPRNGREEDVIDIARCKTGLAECGFNGFFAEISRALDPPLVRLRERIECAVILNRKRKMTSANSDGAMKPLEASATIVVATPFVPKPSGNFFLGIIVLRQSAADRPQQRISRITNTHCYRKFS